MTDLWTFANLLSDVAPAMESIDGRLFLDRSGVGPDALRAKISQYDDVQTAQQWINSVPIDDFIDCAVSDWSIDDPVVQRIADIYARSWLSAIKAKYGACGEYSAEVLKDRETGDVIIRLKQF
jgi:hypothetical protein